MPASVVSPRSAGNKWIANLSLNKEEGLPVITGLIVLNHPDTGLPMAVMDCTWITAKRTGAAGAVAAKYLPRADAEVLAIIGCGVQGRSHLEAMLTQFRSIICVQAYDRTEANLARFIQEMHATHGLPFLASLTCENAVTSADIIVTATEVQKRPAPTIRPEWIKSGAFCVTMDFDAQFTPEAIRSMDLFYSDDTPQMEFFRTMAYFTTTPRAQGDLSQVLTGKKPGRTRPEQRTMAMHLGLAIEDTVTAVCIYERAVAQGVGTRLSL